MKQKEKRKAKNLKQKKSTSEANFKNKNQTKNNKYHKLMTSTPLTNY